MATMIVMDVKSGQPIDRVTLGPDGLHYDTSSARSMFDTLIENFGMTPAEAFDARTGWSNGYVRTTADLADAPPIPGLAEALASGMTASAMRFDPAQRRDGDGRWADGTPDAGDDEEAGDGEGDPYGNVERFPSRYLRQYGHVVDEYAIGEGDLFVAKTDKGAFHVARGENDREVLVELDNDKAGSLADFVLLYSENQPPFHVTDPLSGATLRTLGDGGVRVEWPTGGASDLTEDGALFLQEGLRAIGPGFLDED